MRLQAADLVVLNGADAERWVTKASLPAARVVDTCRELAAELIVTLKDVSHRHGPGGAHAHDGFDPHTWLDPVLATRQAKEVLRGLLRFLPRHEGALQARFDALAFELDAVDRSLRGLGTQPGDEVLFASHPAYDYLARRYGWRVVSFDLDPGEAPSEETLGRVAAQRGKTPGRFLMWESQPVAEAEVAFERLGLTSIVVSPAETLDAAPRQAGVDFLSVMKANVDALRPAFGK